MKQIERIQSLEKQVKMLYKCCKERTGIIQKEIKKKMKGLQQDLQRPLLKIKTKFQ